ncbi:RNA-directed DNA polymerase, eukaryota, reverse transcriptase zinc-binding domain protein [Tanacetum coccineum]
MEGLYIAIKDTNHSNLIKGVSVGNPGIHLSHFFYVDDVVLVTEWNYRDMDNILRLFNVFFLATGLRINVQKSNIYGVGVSTEEVEDIGRVIGCSTGSFPFTYLGLPIGVSMNKINHWQDMIDKFENRLSKWKANVLSIGLFHGISIGSLMNISHLFYTDDAIFVGEWNNHNLDAIIQVLKCFNLAYGLRINMHKIMVGGVMSRISTWEAKIQQVVKRLLKWKLKTLSIGGRLTLLKSVLGSIPIYHMSIFKVLMEVWRFKSQNSSMWARFIKAVHGDNGHIDVIPKSSQSSIWLDIVREVDEIWLGDVTLKHIYPRVYALETNKLISVAEKLDHQSITFLLRHEPKGGTKRGQEIELSYRIADVVLSQMQDIWRWSLTGSGDFLVASVRKYIDDRSLPDLYNPTRWVNAMPIKVNALDWKVSLDNLPTRLNLSIRGM